MPKSSYTVAGAIAVCASAAIADVTANKEIVANMVTEVFGARDVDDVDRHFTEEYIQRNPMVRSGSAVIKEFISGTVEVADTPPSKRHRFIGEGDLVATYSTLCGFGPVRLVAFDIFRIEDGRIAKHWDNLTPLRAEPNRAGLTQTDGWTKVTDLHETAENKALVIELLGEMFVGGECLGVTQHINPAKYLQHNPDVGNGLQNLQDLSAANPAKGLEIRFDEIGIVVAEGNFVLKGIAGAHGNTPTALYDLWRIEEGLIVEHWDVISPIQTENLPDSHPGKF